MNLIEPFLNFTVSLLFSFQQTSLSKPFHYLNIVNNIYKSVFLFLTKFRKFHRLGPLFNKFGELSPAFLLKRDSGTATFLVNFAKSVRTPISKVICERLLLDNATFNFLGITCESKRSCRVQF